MRPRNRLRCREFRSQPRLVPFLLGLMLILAPTLDGAVEASSWSADTNWAPALGLDLCAVPGLVSACPVITPAQLASPLIDSPTVHRPSFVARDRDHPPPSARPRLYLRHPFISLDLVT